MQGEETEHATASLVRHKVLLPGFETPVEQAIAPSEMVLEAANPCRLTAVG